MKGFYERKSFRRNGFDECGAGEYVRQTTFDQCKYLITFVHDWNSELYNRTDLHGGRYG